MNLNTLPKVKDPTKKRLGRGLGSGKGKTGGRGQKGQKARGKVPAANVGAGLILYKKLPFRRGLGNRKVSPKPVILDVMVLNNLKTGSSVDMDSLIKEGLVVEKNARKFGVKILGKGDLKVKLEVKVPTTTSARASIEKAGGSVV